MKKEKDPMGRAIADYWKYKKADTLVVHSPMFDDDEFPVEVLFRNYQEMPPLEQTALQHTYGKTLDVGAGAGCHSLYLQEKGVDVTAIDISPLSVKVMKERGIKKVLEQDFFTLTEQYDTLLMLMNGIGMSGTVDKLPEFFKHLDRVLAPGGQLIFDSSDLCYLFEDEDGIIELPDQDNYYGEVIYQMEYKDTLGEPFHWFYIDADTLDQYAREAGYEMEILRLGDHYDYLARITKKS